MAAAVGISFSLLDIRDYLFPANLVAILVGAVSIFLAFRINTGYSRWWLARQVWGGLINESRALGMYIVSMMRGSDELSDEERELHRRLIFRHIGLMNSLRLQLRRQGPEECETEFWRRKINGRPLFSDREAAFRFAHFTHAHELVAVHRGPVEERLSLFHRPCLQYVPHTAGETTQTRQAGAVGASSPRRPRCPSRRDAG